MLKFYDLKALYHLLPSFLSAPLFLVQLAIQLFLQHIMYISTLGPLQQCLSAWNTLPQICTWFVLHHLLKVFVDSKTTPQWGFSWPLSSKMSHTISTRFILLFFSIASVSNMYLSIPLTYYLLVCLPLEYKLHEAARCEPGSLTFSGLGFLCPEKQMYFNHSKWLQCYAICPSGDEREILEHV